MSTQKIVANPASAAMFLTYKILAVDDAAVDVKRLLSNLPALTRAVSFRRPEDNLMSVVGIGLQLWDMVFPNETKPEFLHDFQEIAGSRHTAISTQADLFIHLRAAHLDMCFEMAKQINEILQHTAKLVDEVHGWIPLFRRTRYSRICGWY